MKEGWKIKPLKDVCKMITDGSHYSPSTQDNGFPYVTVRDLEDGVIDFVTCKFVATADFAELKRNGCAPVKHDVLFSKDGTVGKVALVETDQDFVVLSSLAILRPDQAIIKPKYLAYAVQSPKFLAEAIGRKTGVAIRRVVLKNLKSIEIAVPPLEAQRRIVAVLDEAFAAIATATANAEKNLANARELFDSALREAFTQPNSECKQLTLKEASRDFGRGKSKHRPRNDPQLYGGPYPFIQTGDVRNCEHLITDYTQTYSEAGLLQSKLWPKGTICITIAANIAETGILDFDACFPDSVIGMVVDPATTSNSYTEYLLQSLKASLQAKGKGSAQDNLNLAAFENERFPFPPEVVQMKIVERLHSISEQVHAMEAGYIAKLNALAALKQTLLQRAFTGELTAAALVANDNDFKTPAFAANVIAFAYRRHVARGTEDTFGHVKAQKVLHLCESIGGVDMGRNPIKDKAGPNDFQHMLAAEEWAKSSQFFDFVPRPNGKGYTFRKLARFETMASDGLAAIKPVQDRLEKAIAPTLPMNSEQAELLATVHAAWNNLILDGVDPTDDAIIYEARENWHAAKLKFGHSKFRAAIAAIRTKGIIPDGTAKRVGGQESLF